MRKMRKSVRVGGVWTQKEKVCERERGRQGKESICDGDKTEREMVIEKQ